MSRAALWSALALGQELTFDLKKPVDGITECGLAHKPQCHRTVRTTCPSEQDIVGHCPEECSFVAKDSFFACAVTCVSEQACSSENVKSPFANTTAGEVTKADSDGMCTVGKVPGCAKYIDGRTCEECVINFDISEDGKKCEFNIKIYTYAFTAIGVVVAILAPLIVFATVWGLCKPRGRPDSLKIAWAHNVLCRPNEEGVPYPLSTNMHKTNVAGSGLCLYYNNLIMQLAVFLFMAIVLSVAYHIADVESELCQPLGSCVLGDLQKHDCTLKSDLAMVAIVELLNQYHFIHAFALGICFIVAYFASLWFGYYQRKAYQVLDGKFLTMSDFAVRLENLPKTATAGDVKDWLTSLGAVGLVGVSVAYDYDEHMDFINKLLDHHIQKEDVGVGRYNEEDLFAEDEDGDDDIEDVDKVLDVLQKLECSGTCYAVFHYEEDKGDFHEMWTDGTLDPGQKKFGNSVVDCYLVDAEPTALNWQNYGIKPSDIKRNLIKQCAILFAITLVVVFIFYIPFAYYMLTYIRAKGELSGGLIATVLGIACGIVNGVLATFVDLAANSIGFRFKASIDVFNMTLALLLVVLDTVFNFYLVIKTVTSLEATVPVDEMQLDLPPLGGNEQLIRHAGKRLYGSEKFYELLVPGTLIIPWIIGPLLNYILNLPALLALVLNLSPLGLPADLRSDTKLKPRAAERALEPQPVQIQYDYGNSIYCFLSALPMFFIETRYTARICWILVGFVAWTYLTNWYSHLRLTKVVPFSKPDLDIITMYVWGVPVCALGCASVYWTVIYYGIPPKAASLGLSLHSATAGFFFVSYGLYCVLLYFFRKCGVIESEEATEGYEVAKEKMDYDWFNTNPVHVLKTIYDPAYRAEHGELVYYQRGKEYLQGGDEWLNPDTGELKIPSVHGVGNMLSNANEMRKNLTDKVKRGVTRGAAKKGAPGFCCPRDTDVEMDTYREENEALLTDDEYSEYD